MKAFGLFPLILFCMVFYACTNNHAQGIIHVSRQDSMPFHTRDTVKEEYVKSTYDQYHCLSYEMMPEDEKNRILTDGAMNGDGYALECLLNDLLFWANSLTKANPERAYAIYLKAKAKNPDMHIEDEEKKLVAIKKCIEGGPFDARDFIHKYNIKEDSLNKGEFSIWELAREASLGREFGPPDPHLIFQLVCRGGSMLGKFPEAVDTAYYNWKHNITGKFEPEKYINGFMLLAPSKNIYTQVLQMGADADNAWKIKTLTRLLPNNAGGHLATAYNVATKFYYARAEGEEGLGGSGVGAWVAYAVVEQQNYFMGMIERTYHDSLPDNFSGDSTSDYKLNKTYRKLISYLHGKPYTSGMNLSESGVKDAESAWIPYRDSTAQLLYTMKPEVDESKWKAWVTEQRITELNAALTMALDIYDHQSPQ